MPPRPPAPRRALLAFAALLAGAGASTLVACGGGATTPPPPIPPLPATLAETGLYADPALRVVAPDVLPYTPQYPLWSDGAAKRRWVRLPPGSVIDATDPDLWRLPVGTRLWKEFSFGGVRVETRLLERTADGSWRFAAYLWSPDGVGAVLAPASGVRRAHALRPGVAHDVPSRQDCLACHGARPEPVLGFTALQLSADRDPLAPHAEAPAPGSIDLPGLVARGWLRSRAAAPVDVAPRLVARSARERAARGYLHANCGSCHAADGPLHDLGFALDARSGDDGTALLAGALGRLGRFHPPGSPPTGLARLAGGHPESSLLLRRAASREPAVQMPPLGTRLPDGEALALLEAWVREDLAEPSLPPHPSED